MNRSRSAEINPQPNILREEGNRRKKKQTLGEKKGECHGVVGATAVGPACVSASSGDGEKRGFPLLFFSSLPQAIIVSKRMGRKRRRQKKKRKPSLLPPFPCISPLNDSILRGGAKERRLISLLPLPPHPIRRRKSLTWYYTRLGKASKE